MLGWGEEPGMPQSPGEDTKTGDEDAAPAPFSAKGMDEQRGEGDHDDVKRQEIAALSEQKDVSEKGQGLDEISACSPVPDDGHEDEDHGAEIIDAEDIGGSSPEGFVGGLAAIGVGGAGQENDTDAESGDEDEPPRREAGVAAEQTVEETAELDVVPNQVNQKHVDEA